MALNSRQKLFVKHYLISKNATQAAKAAGYSEKTAYASGAENLKKPQIMAALNEETSKTHEKLDISAERILKRIAEFAFEKENIKASDTMKALELLGKNKKLFTDVQELTGRDGGPQIILTLPSNGSEKPE